MRNARQILPGLLIGLLSILITLGGLALSFAEANPTGSNTPLPSKTNTTLVLIPTQTTRPPSTATSVPSSTPTAMVILRTSTPTISPSPSATACLTPPGWTAYMVKSGDTLESLARKHKIGSETVRLMNCLVTETLLPGSMIYLPPIPTATKVPCGAPAGWILYTVQPGDNLYRLSRAYGITVADLQKANCMGTSTIIITGKKLYVPPWPPIYPTPTEYYMPEPTWTESYFPTESYTPTNIP